MQGVTVRADTSVVWRADLAARAAVRDSTLQASRPLQAIATAANWWGGPGVIWFAAALWLGGRAMGRRAVSRAGLRAAEALAIASAVSGIIKGLGGRARPFVVPGVPWNWDFNHGWADADFFSMPSGHTTATTAFAVGLLIATSGWPGAARLALTIPVLVSAAVVGWGRMYANQHWLSDVAAAMALGTLVGVILTRAMRGAVGSRYERVMLGADHTSESP
jgi:membrane-associated phospholipid phosphatase